MFQQNIIKSHVRLNSENIDKIVKNIAEKCLQKTNPKNAKQLLVNMRDWEEDFWDKAGNIILFVKRWVTLIAKETEQGEPTVYSEELQSKIWKHFLKRLSLNSSLVCQAQGQSPSDGNETLRIFVQVVEDVCYSQFSSTLTEPPLNNQQFLPNQHTTENYIPENSRNQYTTLFEDVSPNNEFPQNSRFLQDSTYSDDDKDVLENTSAKVYVPQQQGMSVKLRRFNSPPKEKKKKKHKKKKRRDYSDSEDESE